MTYLTSRFSSVFYVLRVTWNHLRSQRTKIQSHLENQHGQRRPVASGRYEERIETEESHRAAADEGERRQCPSPPANTEGRDRGDPCLVGLSRPGVPSLLPDGFRGGHAWVVWLRPPLGIRLLSSVSHFGGFFWPFSTLLLGMDALLSCVR